jgi:hypothetical protein
VSPLPAVPWTQAGSAPDFGAGAIVGDIAQLGGTTIVAGQGGGTSDTDPVHALAWSSTDPTTWGPASLVGEDGTSALAVAARDTDAVVVGGYLDGSRALAWRTTDGVTWSKPAVIKDAVLYDVVVQGKGYLAVGARVDKQGNVVPTAWTSPDGVKWKAATIGSAGVAIRVAVGDNGRRVVVGMLQVGDSNLPIVWRNKGGKRWTVEALPLSGSTSNHFVNGLASTGAAFVLALQWNTADGTRESLFVTPDGSRWTEALVPDRYISALGTDAAGYVAMGPGAMWRSDDGLDWDELDAPDLAQTLPRALTGVVDGLVLGAQTLSVTPSVAEVWLEAGAP